MPKELFASSGIVLQSTVKREEAAIVYVRSTDGAFSRSWGEAKAYIGD
jgi:hypothetical protein